MKVEGDSIKLDPTTGKVIYEESPLDIAPPSWTDGDIRTFGGTHQPGDVLPNGDVYGQNNYHIDIPFVD